MNEKETRQDETTATLLNFFERVQKNAINLNFKKTRKTENLPLGTSKFGGKPFLPKDFVWPYYRGKDIRKRTWRTANRPLAFLLQINLEEVAPFDKDKALPERGVLSFFYETVSACWGTKPTDKGAARVFYFDPASTEGAETEIPAEILERGDGWRFTTELAIDFESKPSVPSCEESIEYGERAVPELADAGFFNNDYLFEAYDDARESFLKIDAAETDEGLSTRLLGYADVIQCSMLELCATTSARVPANKRFSKTELAKIREERLEWTLLLQLGDSALEWGDGDALYFYIKKDDLRNRTFDGVWTMLQCY